MRNWALILSIGTTIGTLSLTGCATSRETGAPPPVVAGAVEPAPEAEPESSDPRVGLGSGWFDAEEVEWNMSLVSESRPAPELTPSTAGDFSFMNSDMAFKDNYLIQGNFRGIHIWEISNPASPSLVTALVCPGWQNDVSVYGDLLFASVEDFNSRVDCGTEPMPETANPDRMRGIRIFDISDIANPRADHERPDLPRLAYPHARHGRERPGERLHLRLGVGAGPARRRSSRAAWTFRRSRIRTRRSCGST